MTAHVFVSPKRTVLDPQGQAIQSALAGMGHRTITDVRQGKYFEIAIEGAASAEAARKEIETIAAEVLTNPVIEDYRIEMLD